MVTWAPKNPDTQDPKYGDNFRPSDYAADTSGGELFKGLATGLGGALEVTDTAIKKGIKNAAYAEVDPAREKFSEALELVKGQVYNKLGTGKSILDANASMDEDGIPEGISEGVDQIKLLNAARSAAKVNETQYSAEVLQTAKRLRNQYGPGYRDYIDRVMSEASGMPVANSYYKNLMEDINRQLGQVNKQKSGIDGLVMKNLDVDGIVAYYQAHKADPTKITESMLVQKIADHQKMMTDFRVGAAKRAESDASKKDKEEQTSKDFTKSMNDYVTSSLSDIVNLSGMSKTSDLVQYFEDVAAKRVVQTDAQVQQRKAELDGIINSKYRSMWSMATMGGPNSAAATLGNEVVEKSIRKALFPLQTTSDWAGNKESGPAYFMARQVDAIKKDAELGFLINKDTEKETRALIGARGALGDVYLPDWIRSMVSEDVDQKYKNMVSQERLSAIQPYTDDRGKEVPRSMKEAIQHAKQVGAPSESGAYGAINRTVRMLGDAAAPARAKDRIIDWAFNPGKNAGVLANFKFDYVDPNTGNVVPGKYAAFNEWVSPSVANGVLETAKAKPENWVKYKTTVEGEFATVMREDIKNMDKVLEKTYLQVHYAWDEANNKIVLMDRNNRPVQRNERYIGIQNPNGVYLNGVLDVVQRVNDGLGKLNVIQQMGPEKTDTTVYVYNAMKSAGAAQSLLHSILKSRNPDADDEKIKKSIDSDTKRSNFAPEEDRSVASFVRNPAGKNPVRKRMGNLSDETITNIQVDEIPAGEDPIEYAKKLKSGKPLGGSVR